MATLIELSIAVPQTSPSPWAAWVSPTEKSAPATSTGSQSSVPVPMSRTSMLPPTRRGGTMLWVPSAAGARPMVPQNGLSGTRPPGPKAAGAILAVS
jgi:hypothetical protein